MPLDIQTVYSWCRLDPTIEQIICCPKCFKQYSNGGPSQCNWRCSPRSRPCKTDPYTQHETSGGLQRIPKCLYTTQSFESWLIFLLSHSQIEDHLYQTFAKSQGVFNPGRMHDIYESPAWSSLRPFLQSPYHLVFALYIDWFNPLTNKIAGMSVNFGVRIKINKSLGKVVSCGAIILYCLNLPISIRFHCENTLTIGMTPSPYAPTIWTIPHVRVSGLSSRLLLHLLINISLQILLTSRIDLSSRNYIAISCGVIWRSLQARRRERRAVSVEVSRRTKHIRTANWYHSIFIFQTQITKFHSSSLSSAAPISRTMAGTSVLGF